MRLLTRFSLAGWLAVGLIINIAGGTGAPRADAAQCGTSFNPYAAGEAAAAACGLHVHPLSQKAALPAGGTQYTYDVDGGTMILRVPPAGFDPLNASAAQLAYYYFPLRPSSAAGLPHWEASVRARHAAPPPFLIQGPHPLSQPLAPEEGYSGNCPTGGVICASNWSGYTSQSLNNSYSSIDASYTEPNPAGTQPCNSNAVATWAGLGGVFTSNLAQTGTAYNTASFAGIPNHGAWAEVLPNGPVYLNYSAAANDSMEASVTHQNGGFQFYVTDSTENWTAQYFWSTSSFDGGTAESVLERPNNPNTGYLATLTQFSSPNSFTDTYVNGTAMNGLSNHSPIYMFSQADGNELAHVGSMWSNYGDFYDYYDNCG